MATRTALTSVVSVTLAMLIALGATGVAAQSPGVGVKAPPPERPPTELGLEPTQPYEQQGAREQEFYPGLVRSRHEPAFVTPFVGTVPVSRRSAVKFGLSGWTAPALPFDMSEASGGLAFGLTVLWGVPVPEEKAPGGTPAGER